MKWSPPSKLAWWVSILLVVLGLVAYIIGNVLDPKIDWLQWIGFALAGLSGILLLVSTRVKGI